MLTDVAIKKLKAKDKIYKIADRDGMYVAVRHRARLPFVTTTGLTVGVRR